MRIEEFTRPAGAVTERPRPAAPAWDVPLEHFSASSLQMLENCPEQWRQRYILGKKEPPGQAVVIGRLTHGGVEFGLQTKVLTGYDPLLEEMLVYYQDAIWPQTLDSYGGKSEIIWDDKPEEVRDKAAKMVKAYHPTIGRLEPEAVEEQFTLDLGLQVPIIGFIDVQQRHGRPSIDLKTSEKRLSQVKADWRMQARVYQLACPQPVDFHIITKAKYPSVVTGLEETGLIEGYFERRTAETKRHLAQALNEIEFYYGKYGPDETWPTRGISHPWRCSWCAWQSICPAWVE